MRLLLSACLLPALAGCSSSKSTSPTSTLPLANASSELLIFPAAASDLKGLLPSGWEPFQFEKIPRKTSYTVALDDGQLAVLARAESSASAIRRQVKIDPVATPEISWAWKVEAALEGADLSSKTGDDCAARLLLIYGKYPLLNMLVYAWVGSRESAEVLPSPYSGRVKVIPIRRGNADAGGWHTEHRNHLDDFRKAFGAEPTAIEAVAIMTDTDNTSAKAIAWWRSVRFK